MASSGESPLLDLDSLITTLESKSSSDEQVLESYAKLERHLQVGEPKLFDQDIVRVSQRLVTALKRHVQPQSKGGVNDSIQKQALKVLEYLISDKEIVG
jgi:hypothetical protein